MQKRTNKTPKKKSNKNFIKANKNLGQHFLSDPSVIYNIVESINPQPDENLLEIGPGLGAITTEILAKSKKLTVIELDKRVIPVLATKAKLIGELTIIENDVLKIDYNELLGNQKWRVFGNLPYNISTPILFSLTTIPNISDMIFMLQKEVVDRMEAQAGDKAYGRLSVMLQQTHEIFSLFDVPPESFSPPPKVMSSMVKMITRDKPQWNVIDSEMFYLVVKTAFSMRRKTLRNTLKEMISSDSIESLGINAGLRPEQISGAEFAQIANTISQQES